MKEAILACSDPKCHTIIGDALCPKDASILEYINAKRAHCRKCGEDWHPARLSKKCLRCGYWDLNFEVSSSRKKISSKASLLLFLLFSNQALRGVFIVCQLIKMEFCPKSR